MSDILSKLVKTYEKNPVRDKHHSQDNSWPLDPIELFNKSVRNYSAS